MNIFDAQAAIYDKKVGTSRLAIGKKLRKKLLTKAKGRVLEIACGAGANFPYYTKEATSIVAVDGSLNMVEAARKHADKAPCPVEVLQSPIESLVLPAQSFDTVVSTLSLCAYEDPVRTISHVRDFAKPNAAFLFLEHGRSTNSFLLWLQNKLNGWQFKRMGCHLNRNIEKIITAAGLEIIEKETRIFGAISAIVARKK